MTRNAPASRYRRAPELVRLPARASDSDDRPPVRIFLGTEDGQWRAERIFFYAIEQVRDPDRTYEIHLMKNMAGFDRSGWRTGFTNYRFAIPEYAGFEGKAIYNDVDQIYLADPAELFDLDLNGHGYLAVSAADTSVMLLDCARMSRWWTLRKAIQGRKSTLIREPLAEPDICGTLAGGWNARDLEYVPGESGLIHFTALHLQPWQPFPDDYSYHHNPLAGIWLQLERQADEQGYRIFDGRQPSAQLAAALDRGSADQSPGDNASRDEFLDDRHARRILSLSSGRANPDTLPDAMEGTACRVPELADAPVGFDAAIADGVLDRLPAEDVPWLLDGLFRRAASVYVAVHCSAPGGGEADIDVTRTIRPVRWWRQQLEAVARRYPRAAWQLDARDPRDRVTTLRAEGFGDDPPRVWVLEGVRAGDNAQLDRLARAMTDGPGWTIERRKLKFNPLHVLPNFMLGASTVNLTRQSRASLQPPWPDVVMALGKRSSSTARWIRKQSGGRTHLVQLGRPWSRLDEFDLIVTTPQYRLPARENILHNDLPLTSVTAEALAGRRADIEHRFDNLPRPLTAVLVGGNSWSFAFNRGTARRLGSVATRHARETGGSLLVTTSPRTGKAAARALEATIEAPGRLHRFDAGGGDNPYLDYLAVADDILVTGESASMIADAVATGKPVRLFHPPPRLLARVPVFLDRCRRRFRRETYRGTPGQQGPIARWYDRLVARGLWTPARDLGALHRLLARRGAIRDDGASGPPIVTGENELENTVRCVRELFSRGREV